MYIQAFVLGYMIICNFALEHLYLFIQSFVFVYLSMCICFRAFVFEHLDSLHILGFEGWVRSKDFVKEKVERGSSWLRLRS